MQRKQAGGRTPSVHRSFTRTFMRQWQLYAMVALPVLTLVLFNYLPMGGIVLAFKDYSMRKGILASPWVGMKHFHNFLTSPIFPMLLRNTVLLSMYSFVIEFFIPLVLAVFLNEVMRATFKKSVQMITFFPYFISVVVLVGIVLQILNPTGGLVNNIIVKLGGEPINFMGLPKLFRHIYVWSGVWQNAGYGAVIYIAALSGVDSEVTESAIIDGAGRLKRILHIDLPTIAPTVIIMLIMGAGRIMGLGFEKAFLLQNNLNLDVSEIISTYVYKRGLVNYEFSYATAIDVFNSVVNLGLLLAANTAARRMGETSLW